jgi:hypothetical protein
MELFELKSKWQNAGNDLKNETDLLSMTKITSHPTLKKIRMKLITETIFLLIFLVIYYDWFDGDKKSISTNIFLIVSVLSYIFNDIIYYISIEKLISGSNIKNSIQNYLSRIRRLSIFSIGFSFMYGISLIVFFASVISFTREKSFILLGLIIILFQLMFWSNRVWTKRINSLNQHLKYFDHDENN